MWLLESSIAKSLEAAYNSGKVPTAEQQASYAAQYSAALADGSSRILSSAGGTAKIVVKGVLTKEPNFLATLFGGGNTTFGEINSALASADQDPDIIDAELFISSPGGEAQGMLSSADAVKAFSKPIKTIFEDMGASAAFAIGVQADEVIASDRATRLGSVGVAIDTFISENSVSIASTDAPKKRPDLTTKEGRDIVREELDAIHLLLAEVIADGRNTTVDKVNADFGQGATLLAGEALKRGMIDSIAGPKLQIVRSAKSTTAESCGDQLEAKTMDLITLRTEHPDIYAAAVQVGTDSERDRVTAHLTMGQSSGDMKTACKAIEDGDAMTATYYSKYMSATINQSNLDNRTADEIAAAGAANGASADNTDGPTPAELVATQVEANMGLSGGVANG